MRATFLSVALLALSVTSASAEELPKMTPLTRLTPSIPPLGSRTIPSIPPPEYDHPYEGFLIIRKAPLADLWEGRGNWCWGRVFACAKLKLDSCVITLPLESDLEKWLVENEDPLDAQFFLELVRRHEIGHCNGWPKPH